MQIPVGALVDRVPAKRLLAALAVFAISASALLLALWPTFGVVVVAKVLHAIASSLTGPVLAAISLGLVGHAAFSVRLGRNARYLPLGNAIAAGAMGALAYYFSNRAIFFLTAALAIPTLIALAQIQPKEIDPDLARGGVRKSDPGSWCDAIASLARSRALLIFAAAIVLFQLANAAMLPIMAGLLTMRAPEWATPVLAICILAPQFLVAAIAPWVGRKAQIWGRRPLLALCFVALSIRGRRVRGDKRALHDHRSAAPRRHFSSDARRAGAARHRRHHTRGAATSISPKASLASPSASARR